MLIQQIVEVITLFQIQTQEDRSLVLTLSKDFLETVNVWELDIQKRVEIKIVHSGLQFNVTLNAFITLQLR